MTSDGGFMRIKPGDVIRVRRSNGRGGEQFTEKTVRCVGRKYIYTGPEYAETRFRRDTGSDHDVNFRQQIITEEWLARESRVLAVEQRFARLRNCYRPVDVFGLEACEAALALLKEPT